VSLVPAELWPRQLRVAEQPSGRFNLAEYLLGGKDPARLAIASPRVTYAELDRMVSRVASALVALGLTPGDRVLLHLPNSVEFIACWLAVLRAGGVDVAAMPLLRARELSFILENSGARLAIGHARLWPELGRAAETRPELACLVVGGDVGSRARRFEALVEAGPEHFDPVATDAEDLALIAYTSGSTGPPKGCAHSHGDVVGSIASYAMRVLAPGPGDVCVGNPSMAFTYGLGDLVVFPFAAGAATTIVAEPSVDALLTTLVEVSRAVAATRSRKAKISLLADLLASLEPDERQIGVPVRLEPGVGGRWPEVELRRDQKGERGRVRVDVPARIDRPPSFATTFSQRASSEMSLRHSAKISSRRSA